METSLQVWGQRTIGCSISSSKSVESAFINSFLAVGVFKSIYYHHFYNHSVLVPSFALQCTKITLKKNNIVVFSLEMSTVWMNNGATLSSKVYGIRILYEAVSDNIDLPLIFCSSSIMFKSPDRSCGYNSFYCFGQVRGFLSVKIPKNLYVAAKPSILSGICELMKELL